MTPAAPTSVLLASTPELAVLHVLAASLDAARNALLAAHEELEEEDLCGDGPLSAEALPYVAEAIVIQIAALEEQVGRYRREVDRARRRCPTAPFPF